MKRNEILEHTIFSLVITGLFGILAFGILLLPIFFNITILEFYLRIIAFSGFIIGLFIFGFKYSINYNKEMEKEKQNINTEIIN